MPHQTQIPDLQDELINENVPIVVGPKGELFIVDHHHFASALFQSFLDFKRPSIHSVLYACIQDDFSNMTKAEFWKTMKEENYVYLKDQRGNNITEDQLPTGT